jgi:predicted metal-dependent phosphoesterase TrpH
MLVRCALHVHSRHSFDCYSSIRDIAAEAVRNCIKVVAITDHDVIGITKREKDVFKDRGIKLISGCEITSDRGAHIIGLFIGPDFIRTGGKPLEIVSRIVEGGGVVLIPHPFKPGSGLLSVYRGEDEILSNVLSQAKMIEVHNDKYRQTQAETAEIYRIVEQFGLSAVGSSDAHKPWLIAKCYTEYEACAMDLNDPISLLSQKPISLHAMPDRENKPLISSGRIFAKHVIESGIYQYLIRNLPFWSKQSIKRSLYEFIRCGKNICR